MKRHTVVGKTMLAGKTATARFVAGLREEKGSC